MRIPGLLMCIGLAAPLAACSNPTVIPPRAIHLKAENIRLESEATAPLPLRVPIRGVMIGIVDFSSYGLFKVATEKAPLTDSDWTAAGYAAVNLISAASTITLPGTGPDDASWTNDPRWRSIATSLQAASIDAGIAIRNKDRGKLLQAANAVASSCAACHTLFRPGDSKPAGRQFAQN
ncbi:MAG TPA: hypothetical protein VG942_03820 [Hyphomonadaceae bacterium]|nr:hypothetical protein [Hyphomonadaceae bacterium]